MRVLQIVTTPVTSSVALVVSELAVLSEVFFLACIVGCVQEKRGVSLRRKYRGILINILINRSVPPGTSL
jgi:hypothetical protein